MREIIAALEAAWKKLNPTEPFEYSFLDQDFQKNYEGENRLSALIRYFMIIAIIICCLVCLVSRLSAQSNVPRK
jgi:putative ABC transport system permease protein